MIIKSIINKRIFFLLFSLFLLFGAKQVRPWGAFIGVKNLFSGLTETHQLILKEAWNLLMQDPAMLRFNGRLSFPGQTGFGINEILAYEGVYGNPLTLSAYGPGPDADGASFYSSHWYNPLTGRGKAPQAAYEQYQSFINALMSAANPDEHALRGMAWSAHFVADMFVPYHIVGIPLSEAVARMNARNFYLSEQEAGPLFLYSPIPPVENDAGIFEFPQQIISQWWRQGWGVNNEYSNAYAVFWDHRLDAGANDMNNSIDWFDPWYWNGLPARDLLSSHASYEANAHRLWTQGSRVQRSLYVTDHYDPLWKNAPPDYTLVSRPWERQAWQVQDFTAAIALRTRQNIEAYWKSPPLGIQGAINAVYTLWRSCFSALETDLQIQPDPERTDAYFLNAQIRNYAYEPCQNVQVTLTIQKGNEIVLENTKALAAPLDARNPQAVTWHIQMDIDLNTQWTFVTEAVGIFAKTPDLQHAHDIMYYQPENPLDEGIEEDYGSGQTLTFEGVDFNQGQRAFADRVAGFQAGPETTDGFNNPGNALGPPDNGSGRERTHTALGHGGILVVEFSSVWLVDGPGADLYVFEIGPMIEPFKVEISPDGTSWIDLGVVRGQPSMLDIAGKGPSAQGYRYVRITDSGAKMSGHPYAGADIDAVGAINAARR